MSGFYFAKVPFRNAALRIANRMSRGSCYSNLMHRYDINLVLDVGANKGQYGRHLIASGYRGRIVSFEPLPSALEKLRLNRWGFSNWQVEAMALGDADTTATLNVSGNSQSSSLQAMLPAHIDAAPESAYVSTCEVPVKKIDTIFDRHFQTGDNCYLKLDVQGYEHQVIEGATNSLPRITAIQMELSIQPLYEGEQDWQSSIDLLSDLGYQLMWITPGFSDHHTGAMLQADAVFVRREVVESRRAA